MTLHGSPNIGTMVGLGSGRCHTLNCSVAMAMEAWEVLRWKLGKCCDGSLGSVEIESV